MTEPAPQDVFAFAVAPIYLTRLEEEFQKFHQANPAVYRFFRRFSFQLIERGHEHYSADAIMHRIRWEVDIGTFGDADFKCNNNHVAYYARLFARDNPEYKDFFRFRKASA